ncbi:hypothetical protein HOY82DRAFT_535030 [Tuber indicum]|nr:hypothetical protein HOY82DRAFT_535030 [Tuber indicum]
MLRVLREEEEKKAGWKVVARDNKKRKVDDVVVALLDPKAWAVGKGKTGRVVVMNGILDVVPKGPRSVRQYVKAETGGRASGGLGIGPIASLIPKGPSALVRRGVRNTNRGAKTTAAMGEAMVAAMTKLAEQEREIGRLRHHVSMLSKRIHVLRGASLSDGTRWRKAREGNEEVAFGVVPTPVALPLEAVVPEPVVAEPSEAVVACVASVEEVAEEVVEEVVQVALPPPMSMELTEEEKVSEVQVSGEMLRVLREEEEKKAGWKVVARDNKKRKVDDVVVALLDPKAWAVGKGKTGRVVVMNGILDVVPKGPRSVRQYVKAETGGRASGGLGIGPIASLIPKGPSALVRRGVVSEGWDKGRLRRRS